MYRQSPDLNVNGQRILRSLRVGGPTARIDLGMRNDLSPASITALVNELKEADLIVELPDNVALAKRGRPKILVDLNPQAACVVGVKLSLNRIELVLADFKGQVVDQRELITDTLNAAPEKLVSEIVAGIDEIISPFEQTYPWLLSVGVAFQGVSAPDNSSIIWSPVASLRGFDLGAALGDALKVPVDVMNDANGIALALKYRPDFYDVKNYGAVLIGYGVGLGLILNGTLNRGHFGTASEFGHTKFNMDGPRCSCGKQGCLEAYIGDYALYQKAYGVSHPAPSEQEMQALTHEAQDDKGIRAVFEDAGRVLGFGISNLLALFNPEKLILTGSGMRAYELFRGPMEQTIEMALVDDLRAQTEIIAMPWHEDMAMRGIINLALERI